MAPAGPPLQSAAEPLEDAQGLSGIELLGEAQRYNSAEQPEEARVLGGAEPHKDDPGLGSAALLDDAWGHHAWSRPRALRSSATPHFSQLPRATAAGTSSRTPRAMAQSRSTSPTPSAARSCPTELTAGAARLCPRMPGAWLHVPFSMDGLLGHELHATCSARAWRPHHEVASRRSQAWRTHGTRRLQAPHCWPPSSAVPVRRRRGAARRRQSHWRRLLGAVRRRRGAVRREQSAGAAKQSAGATEQSAGARATGAACSEQSAAEQSAGAAEQAAGVAEQPTGAAEQSARRRGAVRRRQSHWRRLLGQRGLCVHREVRLACAAGVGHDRAHVRAHGHTASQSTTRACSVCGEARLVGIDARIFFWRSPGHAVTHIVRVQVQIAEGNSGDAPRIVRQRQSRWRCLLGQRGHSEPHNVRHADEQMLPVSGGTAHTCVPAAILPVRASPEPAASVARHVS